MVDDPSANPDKFPTEEDQEHERQRLFRIIEELVKWENSNNETVLPAPRSVNLVMVNVRRSMTPSRKSGYEYLDSVPMLELTVELQEAELPIQPNLIFK